MLEIKSFIRVTGETSSGQNDPVEAEKTGSHLSDY